MHIRLNVCGLEDRTVSEGVVRVGGCAGGG